MSFENPNLAPIQEDLEETLKAETPEQQEVREAIESLREPLGQLIEQSWEKIQEGSYDLIVGDDISGRIPTLVLSKFINRVNEALGHNKVPTKFFTGSSNLKTQIELDMKKNMIGGALRTGDVDIEKTQEALVVTDTIATGKSIESIVKALKSEGIEVDVSTLGIAAPNPKATQESLERDLGIKIQSAGLKDPEIHGGGDYGKQIRIHEYAGLTKKTGPTDIWSKKSPQYDSEKVKMARELADDVAEGLFEEFKDRLE